MTPSDTTEPKTPAVRVLPSEVHSPDCATPTFQQAVGSLGAAKTGYYSSSTVCKTNYSMFSGICQLFFNEVKRKNPFQGSGPPSPAGRTASKGESGSSW